MKALQALWAWLIRLFGNPLKAIIGIFVFVGLWIFFLSRCQASESHVHLQGGVSFGCLSGGPILGMALETTLAPGLAWDVGTTLWGAASGERNNFDFHVQLMGSRGPFGAGLGAAYLQNIDGVNGSHLNFALTLYWRPTRLGAAAIHRSNGGTSRGNCGRNGGVADLQLR